MANNQEKIILGVKITDLSWPEIIDEVNAMLSNQQQNLICTPNPEICLLAEENKTFQQLLNAAKICAPDGFGLKIGALILGQRLKNRITGVDLTVKLCEIAEQKICSMMFVGGQWNIASEAAEAMKKQFPNLKIAEERGLSKTWLADNKLFYDPQENERLIARINKIAPAILCVAFGAPKQELWIKENLARLPSVKIAVGVGGTFDFIAGRLPRAPKILRAAGMEWLFRLAIQPAGRAKRIFNAVIKFPTHCLRWRWQMTRKYQHQQLAVVLNETGKILIIKNKKSDKWILPTTNNIESLCENMGITSNQLSTIKTVANVSTTKHPRLIKLLTGHKGVKSSAMLLKFIGQSQNLHLPAESEWQDYKWESRELLVDKIPQICYN